MLPILGSPPCWNLPPTIEVHRPLIFLNIDPFTMYAPTEPAGFNALLNEENQTPMVPLSLIHSATEKVFEQFYSQSRKFYCNITGVTLGSCYGSLGSNYS